MAVSHIVSLPSAIVVFTCFYCFFGWWRLHLDEHFGRDIRHADVYEQLAPTTCCKTNKKRHSPSPPLSKKEDMEEAEKEQSQTWKGQGRRAGREQGTLVKRGKDIIKRKEYDKWTRKRNMEENTGQERGRGIRRGNQTRENKLITLLRGIPSMTLFCHN